MTGTVVQHISCEDGKIFTTIRVNKRDQFTVDGKLGELGDAVTLTVTLAPKS